MTGDRAAIPELPQGRIVGFALLEGRATRPEPAPALRNAPSDVSGKHGGWLHVEFADGIGARSSAGGVPPAEALLVGTEILFRYRDQFSATTTFICSLYHLRREEANSGCSPWSRKRPQMRYLLSDLYA